MIGVPKRVAKPDFRFSTTTATLASSSGVGIGWRLMKAMHAAEKRNVAGVDDERPVEVHGARQQAGRGEPDRGRAERRDRQERVRVQQLLVGSQLGDEAVVRRIEELLHAGVDEDQYVQPDDRDRLDPDDERDDRYDHCLHEAGHDHDLLTVVAVDVDAREQADNEARDGRRHQRQADGERRLGLPVDEDPGGEVGQRGAGGRDQLRQPQQAEVALPEDREHGWRGRSRSRHRFSRPRLR